MLSRKSSSHKTPSAISSAFLKVMSLRGCFKAAAIVAAAFIGGAASAQTAGIQISDFTLENGLGLVVIPDHRAPVVTHMIWYKVGSADETPGKSGLAHFLEHLMFKGTSKHPAGEFSQTVLKIGGNENAFTSTDYTGYFQRVPADQLKTVMEFEADRMTGLQLTDAVVLPEREVILEERNQRMENNPRARLGEQIDAALYLNHPYGKPVIGWRHEMEQLSRDDAIGFYRRFYAPNGAVVVIAGDVEPEAARKILTARSNITTSSCRASGRRSRRRRRRAPLRSPMRASSSRCCSVPIWCRRSPPPRPRQSPANRKRWKCSRISSGPGRTAGYTARWSWTSTSL